MGARASRPLCSSGVTATPSASFEVSGKSGWEARAPMVLRQMIFSRLPTFSRMARARTNSSCPWVAVTIVRIRALP